MFLFQELLAINFSICGTTSWDRRQQKAKTAENREEPVNKTWLDLRTAMRDRSKSCWHRQRRLTCNSRELRPDKAHQYRCNSSVAVKEMTTVPREAASLGTSPRRHSPASYSFFLSTPHLALAFQ